jgi:hypothetical protein
VHNRKQVGKEECNRALHVAYWMGYNHPYLTAAQQNQITTVACELVAYDYGFPVQISHTQLLAWHAAVQKSILTGDHTVSATTPKHGGAKACVPLI